MNGASRTAWSKSLPISASLHKWYVAVMAETITLEFLAAQQRRMLDEMASMRDDIKVDRNRAASRDHVAAPRRDAERRSRADARDGCPECPGGRSHSRNRRSSEPAGGAGALTGADPVDPARIVGWG